MSGFSQIRLYQSTVATVPIGVYTDVTADFIGSATASSVVDGVSYDYDNAIKTVSGLAPDTLYWFWLEAIDSSGNSSGIRSLGSHVTAPSPDESWWDPASGNVDYYVTGDFAAFRFLAPGAFENGTYTPLDAVYGRVPTVSNFLKGWSPGGGWAPSATLPAVYRQGVVEAIEASTSSVFRGFVSWLDERWWDLASGKVDYWESTANGQNFKAYRFISPGAFSGGFYIPRVGVYSNAPHTSWKVFGGWPDDRSDSGWVRVGSLPAEHRQAVVETLEAGTNSVFQGYKSWLT